MSLVLQPFVAVPVDPRLIDRTSVLNPSDIVMTHVPCSRSHAHSLVMCTHLNPRRKGETENQPRNHMRCLSQTRRGRTTKAPTLFVCEYDFHYSSQELCFSLALLRDRVAKSCICPDMVIVLSPDGKFGDKEMNLKYQLKKIIRCASLHCVRSTCSST